MGVCVDLGAAWPGAVVALGPVASLGECTALCPAGHFCGVAGAGELAAPDLDPAVFVEYLGIGFGVAAVPLSLVFGAVVVLRLVAGRR